MAPNFADSALMPGLCATAKLWDDDAMSKLNHRRRNPDPYPEHLTNGYAPPEDSPWQFIDKSMHGWGTSRTESAIADRSIRASIPNDFTDGHRGMARAVKGAKKFVRTRFRFHAKAQLRREAAQEGMVSLDVV